MWATQPGDISAVEAGDFFGTRYGGNTPLLNSSDEFRIGWSYISSSGIYVFRMAGSLVQDYMESQGIQNPHINLWPPSWWGGPPIP